MFDYKARSLDTFINEAMTESQTTKEEELALSIRIAAGDREARKTIVSRNMRFAWHMAKQYDGNGVELCSLVQEAAVALWAASETFDRDRGMKFTSFGAWFIRNALNRIICDVSHAVTFPRFNCSHPMARRVITEMTAELGRPPTNNEFAAKTGRCGNINGIIQDLYKHPVRLDAPLDPGSSESDVVQDQFVCDGEKTDREVELWSDMEFLKTLLHRITDRERQVVELYFGLNGGNQTTLTAIGKVIGLTRERTRQIKLKALDKMRFAAKIDGLRRLRGEKTLVA